MPAEFIPTRIQCSVQAVKRVTDGDPVTIDELRRMAAGRFGDMVKAVVDLQRGVLLLDADMHADQEAALLAEGSSPRDLWGITLYPDLRPSFGNRSRGVDDPGTRNAIAALVQRLVRR